MSQPHGTSAGATRPLQDTVRRLDSASVFAGEREVVIMHRGQEYRLRITKANKLILTK
ncbi:MAG: hemin uptake protein HemP [Candidatus Rokuibacteriota bacterium]